MASITNAQISDINSMIDALVLSASDLDRQVLAERGIADPAVFVAKTREIVAGKMTAAGASYLLRNRPVSLVGLMDTVRTAIRTQGQLAR